ncbi:substrate-binding domain-containing protein [Streptomyces massasporeus]|uniref:substrate-binding domain-containing protein n=1 Tax=Streptomyces massasporeus TaxID=67324 RepID=UPI00333179C6
MSRFDPRGKANRALLAGVSEYDHTAPDPQGVAGQLPAVRHNRTTLEDALHRGGVFGAGEVRTLASPAPDDFTGALRRACREARGLLLLYFAGHAVTSTSGNELHLQMRTARVLTGHGLPGSVSFSQVLGELAESNAEQVVVILDCCYAGNAAGIWHRFDDPKRKKHKILLLMSVQPNRCILGGDADVATPFTRELTGALDAGGEVWLSGLYAAVKERMAAAKYRAEDDDPQRPQALAPPWDPEADVLLAAGPAVPPPPPAGDPWLPRLRALLTRGAGGIGGREVGAGEAGGPGVRAGETGGREADAPNAGAGKAGGREVGAPGTGAPGTGTGAGEAGARKTGVGEADVPNAGAGKAGGRKVGAPGTGARRAGSRKARARKPATRSGRIVPAVLLALLVTGVGGYGILALTGESAICGPPLELRVLTDPDLEPVIRAAADAYVTSDANTTGDGCRRSGVTVNSAGAVAVVTALGVRTDAWQQPREDDNPQRDIGPQPDVWIPATRADVDRVTSAAAREDRVFARLEPQDGPLAYSPVVLAVPKARGAGLDPTGRSLAELLDDLEQADATTELHRSDPESTDSALLATMGLYGDRPGARGAADARAAEQRLARTARPEPSAARLLCTLPGDQAVDGRSTALVPEFLLKTGIGCHPATRVPRVAAYPDDVPGLEPAFVRVRWEDGDRDAEARDDAVDRFRTWLTGTDGRTVLGEHGFRSATGERGLLAAASAPEGLAESVRPARRADPSTMDRALERYGNAHGPGRVLFLLDSSGSMAGRWDGSSGGPGILKQTLPGLGGEDEYGVWAVHGTGDRTHTALVPFGTHERSAAEQALDKAEVRDAEADPAGALRDALEFMRERGTDERPQLIVYLTDGEDDGRLTGKALEDVLDRARGAGAPVAMVSLSSSGCDQGRPAPRVAEAGRGRCLDVGDDLVPALHDEVARTGMGEE